MQLSSSHKNSNWPKTSKSETNELPNYTKVSKRKLRNGFKYYSILLFYKLPNVKSFIYKNHNLMINSLGT